MGLVDNFPYTNFHELNLDWILQMLKKIDKTMDEFVAINALKYADPIQWDITSQYEKNTIVIDPQTGTAYISVQPVPSGVNLTNTDYWTVVFDLGSFVVKAAKNFCSRYEEATTLTATFPSLINDWLIWGDTLYRAKVNITAGDSYVVGGNIARFTMEDIIGHLKDLTTTDKSNLVAALNEVITIIGDLDDLDTTIKENIVVAINELVSSINDIKFITINDNVYPLFITEDLTLTIPEEFSSANDAITSYLNKCQIGPGVTITIKYNDGTYYGEQLTAESINFENLNIIGNISSPQDCKIYLDFDPDKRGFDCGFDIKNSHIGLIAGFHIIGRGMRTIDSNNRVQWNRTYQQCGISCWNDSSVKVKSVIAENCYYPYQIGNGSFMTFLSDEDFLNGIPSTPTPSNISDYYGKYCIAIGGGDVGVFVYNNSGAECQGVISLYNEDSTYGLGHGFISEHGCGIKCYGCASGYNFISGATSSDGSGLSWINHGQLYNNNFQGICARYAAAFELFSSKVFNNNTDGVLLLDSSGGVIGGGCEIYNNQNGITMRDNAALELQNSNNSHDNTYHDILGFNNSVIRNLDNNFIANSPNGIRLHITTASTPPTNGYYDAGDICYNTNPNSNNIYCWVVTLGGYPATWAPVYIEGRFLKVGSYSRPDNPVDGDIIYDISIQKLTVYYNGEWHDASQTMNTFYPTTAHMGSCIYDGTRKMPIWCTDGTNWRAANGHGTSAERPQYPLEGMVYFDTTINKPIFWSGSSWVDATGTIV